MRETMVVSPCSDMLLRMFRSRAGETLRSSRSQELIPVAPARRPVFPCSMDLTKPPPDVARLGMRALKTIAAADGEIHDLERRFAAAVERHILGTDLDFDTLPGIDPGELATGIPEPFRERIVHACLLVALIDGEASAAELAVVDAFADALHVESDAVATAHKLVDDHLFRFRIDVLRRSFLGQRGADFVKERGVRGFLSVAANLMQIENPAMAARYRALEHAPPGSLG